jgi:transcriptional regulator with XRE-family HTH domain
MEPLGGILKTRREELNLSQAELARAAGVHVRQIRRYESGEQQPVLAVAVKMAAALGVTLDELAGVARDNARLEGAWWAAWEAGARSSRTRCRSASTARPCAWRRPATTARAGCGAAT